MRVQNSGAGIKVARGSRYVGVRYSGVLIDVCSMRLCGIDLSVHGAEAGTSIGAFSVALTLHSMRLSTLNPAAPQQSHGNVHGRRRPMAFANRQNLVARHHHIRSCTACVDPCTSINARVAKLKQMPWYVQIRLPDRDPNAEGRASHVAGCGAPRLMHAVISLASDVRKSILSILQHVQSQIAKSAELPSSDFC